MKKQKFFHLAFDFNANETYCMDTGLTTRTNSGSHLRHGGGFHIITAQAHCNFIADLRERSCVITTGTTIGVLLTPDQVRFFCARNKARKKHNLNDLTNRRSQDAKNIRSQCRGRDSGSRPARANCRCRRKAHDQMQGRQNHDQHVGSRPGVSAVVHNRLQLRGCHSAGKITDTNTIHSKTGNMYL